MKTDNNTVIGFVLIGILFIGYFWFTKRQQDAAFLERKHTEDSLARIKALTTPSADPSVVRLDSLKRDSLNNLAAAGNFQNAANGKEQLTVVDNGLIKITFSNKGAQPKSVELKKYKSYDSSDVILAGSSFDNIAYTINTSANQSAPVSSLFLIPQQLQNKPTEASKSVTVFHRQTVRALRISLL